jgi:hypothetical protein
MGVTAAQDTTRVKSPARPDTLQSDTLTNPSDSLSAQADTLKRQAKGDIETTINYTARDSIRASVDGKMIWLYGDAKITYGEIELEAEEVIIDYANSTIQAQGAKDSLGNRIGYPIFKNGAELYETKGIVYNFKTRRASIKEVVTQQGEGYLHSDAAFKNEKNEILSVRNSYTTCNLEHPHFEIISTKTKAIPNDKIVSGPFYLKFNEIPLPFLGFLFGMFPSQRESSSGIIFPSYGEERIRGFNLRNGGYFFDISEYMKLAVTGDIYSKGGHAVYVNSSYMKRYAYTGSFNFSYSKNRVGNNIEDKNVSNDFRLTWSHSPQSKGSGRFSASVNAATSTFNKNNNLMYGNTNELYSSRLSNISTKLSSNVSYSKRFEGTPFTLGVNLSHNQDLVTRLVDLPLPNVTLNMTNIYPFQRRGKTSMLDNFSLGYTMAGTNRITNNLGRLTPEAVRDSIAPFNLQNLPLFLKNGRKGIRHTLPVSYSFKALKYFTMSPSVSYEEKWYFEQLTWGKNSDGQIVVTDTAHHFNRVANYSFSTSLTTRVYGMYFFKNKNKRIKAIRHIINPSISFGYTPDFTKNSQYFQAIPVTNETTGRTTIQYKARHEGFVYGASGTGRAGSIGFSLGNNLEAKIKAPKDTVERKVMLLNNLSISTSYNLMADSFNLAPIAISANTSVWENKVNINLSATLDPYAYGTLIRPETLEPYERRINSLAWGSGRIGRVTSATLGLNTNLNPEKRNKDQLSKEKISKSDLPEQDKQYLLNNPDAYVDFDIPWSLNFGYNVSYSHPVNSKVRVVQTMQMSGDLSISEKWKIRYSSGYDFQAKQFSTTNLGISRDLHCWTMSFDWVPFGRFQSYNFRINVKASVLQDLKLERRKPFFDNL